MLSPVKLIAEPWDVGPGGYQVGNFPARFREWNGKFRDARAPALEGRRELAASSATASRFAGFVPGRRSSPQASVNFITAHDGFTLHDLVTYGDKHNEANGEGNRDGADDNQSWNHGVEGETDDPGIIALRERQKRNLLATLLSVAGRADAAGWRRDGAHPGRQQQRLLPGQRALVDRLEARRRAALAHVHPASASRCAASTRCCSAGASFVVSRSGLGSKDLEWLRPDGDEMTPRTGMSRMFLLACVLGGDAIPMLDERGQRVLGETSCCS